MLTLTKIIPAEQQNNSSFKPAQTSKFVYESTPNIRLCISTLLIGRTDTHPWIGKCCRMWCSEIIIANMYESLCGAHKNWTCRLLASVPDARTLINTFRDMFFLNRNQHYIWQNHAKSLVFCTFTNWMALSMREWEIHLRVLTNPSITIIIIISCLLHISLRVRSEAAQYNGVTISTRSKHVQIHVHKPTHDAHKIAPRCWYTFSWQSRICCQQGVVDKCTKYFAQGA